MLKTFQLSGSIPPFCVAHAKGITVCIVRRGLRTFCEEGSAFICIFYLLYLSCFFVWTLKWTCFQMFSNVLDSVWISLFFALQCYRERIAWPEVITLSEPVSRGRSSCRAAFLKELWLVLSRSEAVRRANAMAEELQKADEYLRKHRILELFSAWALKPSSFRKRK